MNIKEIIDIFFQWLSSFNGVTINIISLSFLFIGSILESLPLLGMFLPMETISVIFGILAYEKIINLKLLVITTFLGLFIGDVLSFYLGKRLGENFIKKYVKKIKINKTKYHNIKYLINNNLFKALFIGRSNSITRWIVPFLAGANRAKIIYFLLANASTAIVWSLLFILGGYYLGVSFETFGQYIGFGIVLATILSYFIYKLYSHFNKLGFFKKEDFKLLALNIFGLYLFSKMVEDVMDAELITKVDKWISVHISVLYSPMLNKIMIFITSMNSSLSFILIIILIITFFIYKRYLKESYFLSLCVIGSFILMRIVKEVMQRQRPEHFLIQVSGYSFPSAHATLSTTIAFSLYLILKNRVKWQKTLLFLAIIEPLFTSFSRIYLTVHYLSDIIAGIGIGLFWTSLVALIYIILGNKHEIKLFI